MALFESTLALLLGAVILTGVARRIGVPYPSLLAIAGAALAFVPAGPELEIEPDLVLALFVAPVLLDAAFDTSPRDLRRNLVPLASLVVVAVGLTTAAVAWVGWRLGGLPIAAAIALGAIVAPPDAAAAAAVLGRLRLPRRILHVLQGESLLNDATALVVYRIAVGVAVGAVTLGQVGPIIALMAVSPIAGWLLARLYLLGTARVRDAASFTVLTFVGTFGVWLLAERVGLSPIITMVTYGMTLSREASRRTTPRIRVSTYSVWETAVFVLNVLAFVIMGPQARPVLSRLSRESLSHALLVSGTVLGTVIVVRIAYVMAHTTLVRLKNRWFRPALAPGEGPTVASGLLVSWCGMRGLVTLATAFALPPGFPGRDLIVLSAFCVVLGTLVVQGFTLRPLLDRLGFEADVGVGREISLGRLGIVQAALDT
jgi:CPA1 family monovalent cation:H+ antiporter